MVQLAVQSAGSSDTKLFELIVLAAIVSVCLTRRENRGGLKWFAIAGRSIQESGAATFLVQPRGVFKR